MKAVLTKEPGLVTEGPDFPAHFHGLSADVLSLAQTFPFSLCSWCVGQVAGRIGWIAKLLHTAVSTDALLAGSSAKPISAANAISQEECTDK